MRTLTRRDFLRKTAACGTAAAICFRVPLTLAADDRTTPFEFALVSDNHLGRVSDNEVHTLGQLVAEINASQARFTLFAGDLVHAGHLPKNETRYTEWKRIVSSLERPWHAVPGNHDPDALFRKHIADTLDFTLDHGPLRFICFRDAKPNPAHDGIVSPAQVRWIQDRLDEAAARGQNAILFSHIAYHANSSPNRGWVITDGRDELTELLQRNRKIVRAFITGHYHFGLFAWCEVNDGLPMSHIVLPSTSWNEDHKLADHVDLLSSDYRPGYTLARYDPRESEIVLTYKPVTHDPTDKLRLRTA